MAKNSGAMYFSPRSARRAWRILRSRSAGPLRGTGLSASHESTARMRGSAPRRRCRRVVPLRCSPAMTSTLPGSKDSISGYASRSARARRRVVRASTMRLRMMVLPRALSRASPLIEPNRASSGARNQSSPKSERPARRRASAIMCSASNAGRSPVAPSAGPIRLKARTGHGSRGGRKSGKARHVG